MESTTWILDPPHSSVEFEVRHLAIATLTGRFIEIESKMVTDDDFKNVKFTFSANVNSISTFDEKRDTHLKSVDFFDAEKFPKISFVSTSFTKINDATFVLAGNFTIRDVTKPITLDVKYGGTTKDNWGNTKAGFEFIGNIKRSDYGLMWNAPIETGGVLVSDEVKLIINIEYVKIEQVNS